MRQYDTVGRLGGDEFVIIINDAGTITDIIAFVEKVLALFQEPFDILEHPVYVTSSIGVAVFPLHGTTIESLMKKADMAMYVAKKSGRNTYRFYTDAMDIEEYTHKNMRTIRRISHIKKTGQNTLLAQLASVSNAEQVTH